MKKFVLISAFMFPATIAAAQTNQGGYLGVEVTDITPQLAIAIGKTQDSAKTDGAEVISISSDSPAALAHLKSGDIIIAINGREIDDAGDLASEIANFPSGKTVDVTYIRTGTTAHTSVILGEKPKILPGEVLVDHGNLFSVTQLTSQGLDSSPVLSIDKETAYFIRTSGTEATDSSNSETEIWMVSTVNGVSHPILKQELSDDPKKNLSNFSNLELSLDGRNLFFISDAWATSGAIHSLDLATNNVTFLIPGNAFCIIQKGANKGDLAISQHKYYNGGGSYDDYWLFSPTGQPIGSDLGPSEPQNCL